jgi:hypothetical protein
VRSSDRSILDRSKSFIFHVNGVVPSTSTRVYSANETIVGFIVRFIIAFVAVQAVDVGHGRVVGGWCGVVWCGGCRTGTGSSCFSQDIAPREKDTAAKSVENHRKIMARD